jgi:hypothetical protein
MPAPPASLRAGRRVEALVRGHEGRRVGVVEGGHVGQDLGAGGILHGAVLLLELEKRRSEPRRRGRGRVRSAVIRIVDSGDAVLDPVQPVVLRGGGARHGGQEGRDPHHGLSGTRGVENTAVAAPWLLASRQLRPD